MYNTIGIIGLGLIGGSLAKAFRNRVGVEKIIAYNHNEDVLKQAYDEGVIDQYTTSVDLKFSQCDIIFICTPVDLICSYVKELLPFIKDDCIITDVGSTKGKIYDRIKAMPQKINYIGGHPMTLPPCSFC